MDCFLTEKQQKDLLELIIKTEVELLHSKERPHRTAVVDLPDNFDFSGNVYSGLIEHFDNYRIMPENSIYGKKLILYCDGL
ncbi:MAG: hypothetical protein ACLFPQ_05465 [Candidatus Woesearchaeota archaeon]